MLDTSVYGSDQLFIGIIINGERVMITLDGDGMYLESWCPVHGKWVGMDENDARGEYRLSTELVFKSPDPAPVFCPRD